MSCALQCSAGMQVLQLRQLDSLVENKHQITWFPNMWAQNLLRRARRENLIGKILRDN